MKLSLDFLSRNDAYSIPKKMFFENYEDKVGKMVWIFCPEMTLAQFQKSNFWNFCWIFCPEMTLAQFPKFGFFVRNSRIGVNRPRIVPFGWSPLIRVHSRIFYLPE